MERICLNCGKILNKKTQIKYCSSQCQADHRAKLKILAWKNGEFDGIVGESELSDYIRNYLLKKHNYKCEICGWGERNIFTDSIPLEIHHKDGNYKNNEESNLQVLCPNCHSLTASHKGANKNKGREDRMLMVPRKQNNKCALCGTTISNGATYCRICAGKAKSMETQPPIKREELKKLIRTTTFVDIGKQYNISDNGVRKWCKKYNLPYRVIDIKQYSDEEWEKI